MKLTYNINIDPRSAAVTVVGGISFSAEITEKLMRDPDIAEIQTELKSQLDRQLLNYLLKEGYLVQP